MEVLEQPTQVVVVEELVVMVLLQVMVEWWIRNRYY
jgi:hypothetical protein